MKKVLRIMRILIISIWPVVFLLVIGSIEMHFKALFSKTLDPIYQYWTAIIYAVSGCLFAVSGFYRKEDSEFKGIIVAQIIAGASVLLFFIVWLAILFTGGLWNTALQPIALVQWNVLPLIFGYTLLSTARAIILSRKRD